MKRINARMVCQVYTVPKSEVYISSKFGEVQTNLECSFNVAGVVFKKKTAGEGVVLL